jgi:tetratricopeptide (TPR) repeat protein
LSKNHKYTRIIMGNFLKSLFSSSETTNPDETLAKSERKNFDMFKYDGLRAMRTGQVKYAVKCYTAALKIKEDKEVMQFLITAHSALHESDEALIVANRLVELYPEDVDARVARAGLFYQMEKENEAIEDCLNVIATDESHHVAWFLMGRAKKKLGNLSGATDDLTRAIATKADFADAYLLRGEALLEANQVDEALLDAEKLMELAPEEEAVYLLKGRIYEQRNDFAAAADNYSMVVELNPFNEEASLLKGALLIREGKFEEAIAFFDEIVELNPASIQAYRGRSKAKSLNGNVEGASEDKAKAEELESECKEEGASEGKPVNFNNIYKGGIF